MNIRLLFQALMKLLFCIPVNLTPAYVNFHQHAALHWIPFLPFFLLGTERHKRMKIDSCKSNFSRWKSENAAGVSGSYCLQCDAVYKSTLW